MEVNMNKKISAILPAGQWFSIVCERCTMVKRAFRNGGREQPLRGFRA
jgi:hypothetical protein